LRGNENIESPLEVDSVEAEAEWEKMNGEGPVNLQISAKIENVGVLSRWVCGWTR
jgi:hypothetical protein